MPPRDICAQLSWRSSYHKPKEGKLSITQKIQGNIFRATLGDQEVIFGLCSAASVGGSMCNNRALSSSPLYLLLSTLSLIGAGCEL